MIGKIVKGRSFKGCISYVLGSKDAKLLASEGVLETDTKSIINSFYMQSLMNPNLSKSVGHTPLAFSPKDTPRLTDQFILQLAREYMKAMEIKNTQYIIVRHNNTAHPHLHIIFNRVDNDGKTVSDKNDHFRNEKVCRQLKDNYNLTYGKGKERKMSIFKNSKEQSKPNMKSIMQLKIRFQKSGIGNSLKRLLTNREYPQRTNSKDKQMRYKVFRSKRENIRSKVRRLTGNSVTAGLIFI